MRFIEKKEDIKLECGDFVLFENGLLGMVMKGNEKYGMVCLDSGYSNIVFDYYDLEDLIKCIKEKYPKSRIIKSKNIVITEV